MILVRADEYVASPTSPMGGRSKGSWNGHRIPKLTSATGDPGYLEDSFLLFLLSSESSSSAIHIHIYIIPDHSSLFLYSTLQLATRYELWLAESPSQSI